MSERRSDLPRSVDDNEESAHESGSIDARVSQCRPDGRPNEPFTAHRPTFSRSASHTACVPARRGRKSRDGHTLFCDCLAGAANNPEKRDGFLGKQTGAIPGLILASDWITVVPSGRIASRQRERLAISAAPPRQSRRGGRAQVTVGRDCPSACTRANPAYQTAAYRTAPVPVTDDPLATRPHAPPRPLG